VDIKREKFNNFPYNIFFLENKFYLGYNIRKMARPKKQDNITNKKSEDKPVESKKDIYKINLLDLQNPKDREELENIMNDSKNHIIRTSIQNTRDTVFYLVEYMIVSERSKAVGFEDIIKIEESINKSMKEKKSFNPKKVVEMG